MNFTIQAEQMPVVRVPWFRRLWLWATRRPLPSPPQPPGTQPMWFDYVDGDVHRRVFIPAARIVNTDQEDA